MIKTAGTPSEVTSTDSWETARGDNQSSYDKSKNSSIFLPSQSSLNTDSPDIYRSANDMFITEDVPDGVVFKEPDVSDLGIHPIGRRGSAGSVLDRMSQLSYIMIRDFRYYFQHPYCRLFITYFVVLCNFLIFAEDPVSHSEREADVPILGNSISFVCNRYPPNGYTTLKVFLVVCATILGMLAGKKLTHQLLLRDFLRLKMFRNDHGSFMMMFLTTIVSVFIMSVIYNVIIGALASPLNQLDDYSISSLMGIKNTTFMKLAACGTWLGDFITAWMVTDMMLQDRLYPRWAMRPRKIWRIPYIRIVLFWVVSFAMTVLVISGITTDFLNWDYLNHGFVKTDELSRAFLASSILIMDLLIVIQDWEFPHFMGNIDVNLPGIATPHIKVYMPKCLNKEKWAIHVTGKWFNYGIICMVIILDLNMWKNQIFYDPYTYGQYVDPGGSIHTVLSQTQLNTFNETMLTYTWRSVHINPDTNRTYISQDLVMHSSYLGYSLTVKSMAFVPSVGVFILFGWLIYYYGRFGPDDPALKRMFTKRKKLNRKRDNRVVTSPVPKFDTPDSARPKPMSPSALQMETSL